MIAVGDVHGCDVALSKLIERLAPQGDDTLVFLGDVVDRGPSSSEVVDRILQLGDVCQVVALMGNHEEMLWATLSGRHGMMAQWLHVGGQETVDSYGSVEQIPLEHLRFLVGGRTFYETETEIFIHASLETGVTLANQDSMYLRWKHLGGSEPPYFSGKRVICGHTAQRDGMPLVFDGWVCIDTFVHGGMWLSALDVGSDHVYQTNQQGEYREFPLPVESV